MHEDFSASIGIGRLTLKEGGPVTSYTVEIRIICAQCAPPPFEFQGLEPGLNLRGATVSLGNQEARLAITPHGAAPTPLDVIGFSIRGHQA